MTVLDEYTRQALAVTVRNQMRADDVLAALYPLLLRHGTPEYIHSDNGPEFIAQAMQDWSISNRCVRCVVASASIRLLCLAPEPAERAGP